MFSAKTQIHHPPAYLERQIRLAVLKNDLSKEVVWTYLLAKKYEKDPSLLAEKLCNTREKMPVKAEIWLEAYLFPTRERYYEQSSWKTRADLAIGHLKTVEDSANQIMADGEWVCLVESKWFDDIHSNSEIPEVNQMAQLIEHALLLHDQNGNFPKRVYVTLLTPANFMKSHDHFSDMKYLSKYHEYQDDRENLIRDLKFCTFPYLKHDQKTLIERVGCLMLNWVSFDDLLGLPELVETCIPGKYRTTRKCWKDVFAEMGKPDFLEEIIKSQL